MTGTRIAAVLMICLGLAAIGVALAFLYQDFVSREGAWVELRSYHPTQLSDEKRQDILEAWRAPDRTFPALIAGCLGVALFAGGGMITLFESRWFSQDRSRTERA